MVCSCAMLSNWVLLRSLAVSLAQTKLKTKPCFLLLAIVLAWKKKGRSIRFPQIFIKNKLWQIIELVATDKSLHFTQLLIFHRFKNYFKEHLLLRTYHSPPHTHTTQTYVKFGDFAERYLSLVSNKSRSN